ncbi:MAG TPA: AraC family transcriptional regulator [Gemmatimonadaceae bacterium]
MRVAIFLPTQQANQIMAAMDAHDQVCVADSWDGLESIVRLEPLSVVVFNPAADGTMDNTRACRLICKYASIPFIAYVPVDAAFVRGIAHMSNDGLQDVVVYHSDDSPSRFRKTLERVSSVPQVSTLIGMLEPWFQRLPMSLVDVLTDTLRQPHEYASAEDVAVAANMTLSALYRSFRNAQLNSPKSFVVGARVFRGCVYLRDSGFSIGDVAIKLGYTHPRIFAHHIECVLGECPSKVRHSLDDAQAVSRIVSWLGSSTRSCGQLLKHEIVRAICFLALVNWG